MASFMASFGRSMPSIQPAFGATTSAHRHATARRPDAGRADRPAAPLVKRNSLHWRVGDGRLRWMLMKRRSILLLIARSRAPGRRMQSSAGYPKRARSDGGRKLGNFIAGGVARSNGSERQIWKARSSRGFRHGRGRGRRRDPQDACPRVCGITRNAPRRDDAVLTSSCIGAERDRAVFESGASGQLVDARALSRRQRRRRGRLIDVRRVVGVGIAFHLRRLVWNFLRGFGRDRGGRGRRRRTCDSRDAHGLDSWLCLSDPDRAALNAV